VNPVRFEKWQGLGNDFLVTHEASLDELSPERVARLCDRHFGVGGDGVLLVSGLGSERPRMTVQNADGSRPEMCGNGLRCAVGYVLDRAAPLAAGATARVVFDTDAGERVCTARRAGAGWEVEVDMGVVELGPTLEHLHEGRALTFHTASAGNPHAVLLEGAWRDDFARVGPEVSRLGERGTNVELVRELEPGATWEVLVWERGVGPTLACGTGACAVARVLTARGLAEVGAELGLRLPGGMLRVRVDAGGRALMKGPALRVFRGET
jgi:diaminopimelate epimerase